ncbi:radical SAM protein, partial [Candidatus Bathyarchaeota archaeon ex4484_135]
MARGKGYKIVLTSDRTLMSEYGGGIFMGFSACVPKGLVPDYVYFNFFCPSIKVGPNGEAEVAPCGLRRIEAALLEYGFDRDEVIVAHPEYLDRVIGPETKAIGINETDPLGIGPATTTFTELFGGEAYMAIKFREIIFHP